MTKDYTVQQAYINRSCFAYLKHVSAQIPALADLEPQEPVFNQFITYTNKIFKNITLPLINLKDKNIKDDNIEYDDNIKYDVIYQSFIRDLNNYFRYVIELFRSKEKYYKIKNNEKNANKLREQKSQFFSRFKPFLDACYNNPNQNNILVNFEKDITTAPFKEDKSFIMKYTMLSDISMLKRIPATRRQFGEFTQLSMGTQMNYEGGKIKPNYIFIASLLANQYSEENKQAKNPLDQEIEQEVDIQEDAGENVETKESTNLNSRVTSANNDKKLQIYYNYLPLPGTTNFKKQHESNTSYQLHQINKKYGISDDFLQVITLPANTGYLSRNFVRGRENQDMQDGTFRNEILKIKKSLIDPEIGMKNNIFIPFKLKEVNDKSSTHISEVIIRDLINLSAEAIFGKKIFLSDRNFQFDTSNINVTYEQFQAFYFHLINYELKHYINTRLKAKQANDTCYDGIDRGGSTGAYYEFITNLKEGNFVEEKEPQIGKEEKSEKGKENEKGKEEKPEEDNPEMKEKPEEVKKITVREFNLSIHGPALITKGRRMNHQFETLWRTINAVRLNKTFEHKNKPQWLDGWCSPAYLKLQRLVDVKLKNKRKRIARFFNIHRSDSEQIAENLKLVYEAFLKDPAGAKKIAGKIDLGKNKDAKKIHDSLVRDCPGFNKFYNDLPDMPAAFFKLQRLIKDPYKLHGGMTLKKNVKRVSRFFKINFLNLKEEAENLMQFYKAFIENPKRTKFNDLPKIIPTSKETKKILELLESDENFKQFYNQESIKVKKTHSFCSENKM